MFFIIFLALKVVVTSLVLLALGVVLGISFLFVGLLVALFAFLPGSHQSLDSLKLSGR